MLTLDFEQEYDRASPAVPFANGFEAEHWTAAWCERCAHQDTCPLPGVAALGRTPAAWSQIDPGALAGRYRCALWLRR